jgi:hypothetical protein
MILETTHSPEASAQMNGAPAQETALATVETAALAALEGAWNQRRA